MTTDRFLSVSLFGLASCAVNVQSKVDDTGGRGEESTVDTGESDSDVDADNDGYSASIDCDETNNAVHPSATEVCNTIDDDCDGAIDDEDDDVTDRSIWYVDADGDGFGGDSSLNTCVAPEGTLPTSGDCDDADGLIHPGAVESCDGRDDDCDGLVDEACHPALYGDVASGDADTVFLTPCDESEVGYLGNQLADVNGDAIADFGTWSVNCGELALHVALGPMTPSVNLSTSTYVWTPGIPKLSPTVDFYAGVDITGDGRPDWVAIAGAFDDPAYPLTAWFFDGVMTGAEQPSDAVATVEVSPPYPQAVSQDFDVVAARGNPGTVVLMGTFYSGTDAADFTMSWALDGDVTGTFLSTALAVFETPVPDGWSSEDTDWNSVGDLDGDGYADLLRTDGDVADVFLGPAIANAGSIPIDVVLGPLGGGTSTVADYRSVTSADVDNDGRDDVVVVANVQTADGPHENAVLRTTYSDGAPSLDEHSPILIGSAADVIPLGYAVAALNADGDAVADIAVRGERADGSAEAVYLEYGPFAGTRELGMGGATLYGTSDTFDWGNSLLGGDTNGDGFDDLLVGSGEGWTDPSGTPVDWLFLGGP